MSLNPLYIVEVILTDQHVQVPHAANLAGLNPLYIVEVILTTSWQLR